MKFLKHIKNYWFSFIIAIMIIFFIILAVLIMLSPRTDAKNRGFIPCTQAMIYNLSQCNNSFFCAFKSIIDNTVCDIYVVHQGFINWYQKKQPTPWSNYIYKPISSSDAIFNETEINTYLSEHPNTAEDMEKLHKLRKDLENAQQEDIKLWNQENNKLQKF